MTQAEYLAVKRDIFDLKRELNFMPTELEKTNLEAHVDLCSERYRNLHDRLSAIEVRLGKMHEDQATNHKSHTKILSFHYNQNYKNSLNQIIINSNYYPLIQTNHLIDETSKSFFAFQLHHIYHIDFRLSYCIPRVIYKKNNVVSKLNQFHLYFQQNVYLFSMTLFKRSRFFL